MNEHEHFVETKQKQYKHKHNITFTNESSISEIICKFYANFMQMSMVEIEKSGSIFD